MTGRLLAGRYRLVEQVGVGGMAIVYRAIDENTGHYVAVMVEGRYKKSRGCTLVELAELMKKRGCVQAMNLDGGETSCILFMGKQICTVGHAGNKQGYARKEPEFLAIGTSELVEGYEPAADQ